MPRVLIADSLSPAALKIFRDRGVEADTKIGLSKDQLLEIIAQYDGLAVPLGDQGRQGCDRRRHSAEGDRKSRDRS